MQPEHPTRLHALDNLRAIMMWLGIVLHAAALHMALDRTPMPWIDTERTFVADLLVTSIHAFRMPVFFILAGFFAAMLGQTRGADGMLRNRLQRLALPFAVLWPPIFILNVLAGLGYLNLMAYGHWGLDQAAAPRDLPRGANTMHMWFLWQLLWLCVAAWLLMKLPRRWFAIPADVLQRLARAPWGAAVLALPVVVASAGYAHGIVEVRGSFLPPWNEWLYDASYFVFGFVLFAQREPLFALYQRHRVRYAVAGFLFWLATGMVRNAHGPLALVGFLYACAGWFWSFALIGWALTSMAQRHRVLAYLADSAYWVYLLHLPLVIFFGAVMYGLPIHPLAKIVLNIGAATLVCLVTYELFVRHTWMSVLLNGKRHPGAPFRPLALPAA